MIRALFEDLAWAFVTRLFVPKRTRERWKREDAAEVAIQNELLVGLRTTCDANLRAFIDSFTEGDRVSSPTFQGHYDRYLATRRNAAS